MPAENYNNGKNFLTIVGGRFKERSEEGVLGANLRKYELKDGTKGEKWELSYDAWRGTIKDIQFNETKYGKVIELDMDDVTIQISKQSRYFSSLLEKLPALDIKKEIIITPYSFEAEGKQRTGVSIKQQGVKIKGYFFDGKNSLHGIPDGKEIDWGDSDEAKMFFMERDKFLVDYIQKNIVDKFFKQGNFKQGVSKQGVSKQEKMEEIEIPIVANKDEDDDVKIEDIPF